jgi:hypothetical protein
MTYKKIVYGTLSFPKHFSRSAMDIVQRFLHQKPSKRLGSVAGGADLCKQHVWFKTFSFDDLESGRMKAPIVPKIKSKEDLSNFEIYPEDDNGWKDFVDDGTKWYEGFASNS